MQKTMHAALPTYQHLDLSLKGIHKVMCLEGAWLHIVTLHLFQTNISGVQTNKQHSGVCDVSSRFRLVNEQ